MDHEFGLDFKTTDVKMKKQLLLIMVLFLSLGVRAQSNTGKWIKVSDDEIVTIYYNSNITTDRSGNHIVWVKADYHDSQWQNYLAQQIGRRTPVAMTKTKAKFDEYYSYVMVRQVICYNKAGKQMYNTGEDSSAGWGPVNASDPVGIVGERLGDELRYKETYGF